eukprot:1522032-Rhodomonas_salina.4
MERTTERKAGREGGREGGRTKGGGRKDGGKERKDGGRERSTESRDLTASVSTRFWRLAPLEHPESSSPSRNRSMARPVDPPSSPSPQKVCKVGEKKEDGLRDKTPGMEPIQAYTQSNHVLGPVH